MNSRRQIMIGAAMALMLIAAIVAIAMLVQSPSRRQVSVPVESHAASQLPPPRPRHTLDRSWGIAQVNRAHQLQRAGDLKQAEAILKQVMDRPTPEKPDLQTWVPQLFVAPLALAEIWQGQGKTAEADALNRKVADKAFELFKLHPNEQAWIPSYAAAAYMQRIHALLRSKPAKIDDARALAEEFQKRLPAYTGIYNYPEMIGEIAAIQPAAKAD